MYQVDVRKRFEDKMLPEPNTGCVFYMGATSGLTGYGTFWMNGRQVGAHRAAYSLFVGDIPDDLHVLHKCDVPSCVNPRHLWLGTHDENMQDCIRKGRRPRGTEHGRAVLTEAMVKEIRNSKDQQKALGEKYGVSSTQIARIKRRQLWDHVK